MSQTIDQPMQTQTEHLTLRQSLSLGTCGEADDVSSLDLSRVTVLSNCAQDHDECDVTLSRVERE